jgi:phytoene/squalene synthetase
MSEYCAEQLRRNDYPHYVMTLLAPPSKRPALFALYAFRLELAKIRHLVTEPMMGLIRMEWWRETIAKLYRGEVLRHEVVAALNDVIKNTGWREQDFMELIDAYDTDLRSQEFTDIWQHAETMGGPLLRMSCAVYGQGVAELLLEIIGSSGWLVNALEQDNRLYDKNKKAIMNEIIQKINLVDRRRIKGTPALSYYNFIKWKLRSLIRSKKANELLLGFHLWRKSFIL